MLFRVESEMPPTVQIRLKVEINCFEHFNVLGLTKIPFKVENSWFTGEAELTTYHFEELLGTKLRALYQRKKGRDLFDLYIALQRKEVDVASLIRLRPISSLSITCRRRWQILSLPMICNLSCGLV